jgi:spore germination protein (amino acid permease)
MLNYSFMRYIDNMNKDKLTAKHLLFIIWGTTIVSIKTNINIFIRDGQRDTWIAIILSSVMILFYLIYTVNTCVRHNNFNFVEVYHKALGKKLGTVFLGMFILTLFLTLIECTAVESNAMQTNIFLETPTWYLILFFVIPAIYTIKNGIVPLITVSIIGMILAMIAGINLVILTSKYKEYKLLLPVLAEGINPGFIKAVFKSLGFYGSLAIVFPYFGYVQKTKEIRKYAAIGLLFVMQMHIVATTGAITSFGSERVLNLSYPKLIQTQQINYFGFLESGEFFVMFQIIGGWFVKYILAFQAIIKILEDMKIENKSIVFIISAPVLVLSYFASTCFFRLSDLLIYYSYICLINFIVVPMIVFTIFDMKNKKEKKVSKERDTA